MASTDGYTREGRGVHPAASVNAEDITVTRRRVVLFAACSMAGAVLIAAVIAATGGLTDSPTLVHGTPLTLATVLAAGLYMLTPTMAHLAVRRLTGEGWAGARAVLRLRVGWRVWAVAWFAPAVLTLVGAAVFYALRPAAFDPSMAAARDAMRAALPAGTAPPVDPLLLVLAQVAVAVTIAPLFNALFAFGEEFGWRGYLQPKLLALMSPPRALLVMGVIWGVWHWPLILLGYEYGTGYPGAPWLGCMLFWCSRRPPGPYWAG